MNYTMNVNIETDRDLDLNKFNQIFLKAFANYSRVRSTKITLKDGIQIYGQDDEVPSEFDKGYMAGYEEGQKDTKDLVLDYCKDLILGQQKQDQKPAEVD